LQFIDIHSLPFFSSTINQHRSRKAMSSTTAAKTEDRQQDNSVYTRTAQQDQQDATGAPSMSVNYHE